MRANIAAMVAVAMLTAASSAAAQPSCAAPDYLLFSDSQLAHVRDAISKQHHLTIAVVGTGSSALAGPEGRRSAYPARLEAALNRRLSNAGVKVIALVRTRLTAEDLAKGMEKVLTDEKPDLVVWQTGTIDAIRRIDPDSFKAALEDGVERLHKGGTDVVLMNMQYSPRTESMIAVGPYVDAMRAVALQHSVPLFDRFGLMRHWADIGVFDLQAGGRDNVLAERVHDCIGRAIATLVIDAGHLRPYEQKTER
jgi:lysophospholipase L1-like esterase